MSRILDTRERNTRSVQSGIAAVYLRAGVGQIRQVVWNTPKVAATAVILRRICSDQTASLMIMGVSSRVVPILAGMDSKHMNSLWVPFILINLGCIGRVVLQVLTDFAPSVAFPLVGFTGFIEFAALLWWGVEVWRTMNVAKTSRTKLPTAPFPLEVR